MSDMSIVLFDNIWFCVQICHPYKINVREYRRGNKMDNPEKLAT